MTFDLTTLLSGISSIVANYSDDILDLVETGTSDITDDIADFWNGIVGYIQSQNNDISDEIDSSESSVKSKVTYESSKIADKLDQKTEAIQDSVNSSTSTLSAVVSTASSVIQSFVQSTVGTQTNTVASFLETIGALISSTSRTIGSTVSTAYETATDRNVKVLKDQRDAINNLRTDLGAKVKNSGDKLGDEFHDLNAKVDDITGWLFGLPINIDAEQFGNWLNDTLQPIYDLKDIFEEVTSGEIDTRLKLEGRIKQALGESLLGQVIFSVLLAIPASVGSIGAYIAPYLANVQRIALADARPNYPSQAEFIDMWRKKIIDNAQLRDAFDKVGLDRSFHSDMALAAVELIPPEAIQQLFLRGIMNESMHDLYMSRFGYSNIDVDMLKELYFFLPPVQDLIRMAVREVFTPEIASAYGLNRDYPSALTPLARKVGLNEETARQYWAAHWELPSATQGFEMFHRGFISYEELETLLRALDYMPFWREPLINMAYNPLTRVDTRRMYGLGVLNRNEVKRAYKDLGYNDENAERLTEFTIRYEDNNGQPQAEEFRALTRTTYERAYDNGVMSREEAKDAIKDLGYHSDDAELLLDIIDFNNKLNSKPEKPSDSVKRAIKITLDAYRRKSLNRKETLDMLQDYGYSAKDARSELDFIDYEVQVKLKDNILTKAKAQYLEGLIERHELVTILSKSDFVGSEIGSILRELDVIRDFKDNKPSKTELLAMFKKGIIEDKKFLEELSNLGYNDQYVLWYARLYGIEEQ